MKDFALPPKLLPALQRLHRHYSKKSEKDLCRLLESSRFHFEWGTTRDNWNGGTYGHDAFMFVPSETIDLVDLDDQDRISERIRSDLDKINPEVEDEYIRVVYIKMIDENDPQCQSAIPFSREPYARPEDVDLWKGNTLRLFLSHRDEYKSYARELAEALEPFGVSVFVAHDTIEPMKEWQREILNGLKTMEVMLVLLTDDFHKSYWTNQEIGFALAKGTPIICVKVGTIDPQGFIGSRQALKGSLEKISDVASQVYRALYNEIGQKGRLKEILIEAFVSSECYPDTIGSFKRLKETADQLNESELQRIIEGYARNSQLHDCGGIRTSRNSLKQYLEDATGKKFKLRQNEIIDLTMSEEDDIPF